MYIYIYIYILGGCTCYTSQKKGGNQGGGGVSDHNITVKLIASC